MPAVPGDQWRDALTLNPPSIPITTDWAQEKATVAKSRIAETVESCIQAAKSALRVGHVIKCV